MARSYRGRFLGVLRANERRMVSLFTALATGIVWELTRRGGADGTVPRSAVPELQTAVAARVMAVFLGRNAAGDRAPFDVLPDGTVYPLSPYMRALWQAIGDAVRVPVQQQATAMRRALPADIERVMRTATDNPFAAAKAQVREQIFRPNPLARYDPPHRWVDPSGYTLSDRIWNLAGDTRRRLDLYLERQIAAGRGARELARELEQFLVPGRALLRTKAPYGSDASYDAMRLARTEITRAHGQATKVTAAMNPYVAGLKWNLSGSHPKPDICDDRARGGPNSDGVYPVDEFPGIPAHPNCLCYATQVLIPVDERQTLLDELRDDILRERAELVRLVGPLMVDEFTNLLLGRELQATRAAPLPVPVPILEPSPPSLPPLPVQIVQPETPESIQIGRMG